jgi:predicted DsbA family dithiol-disulfide isomerase
VLVELTFKPFELNPNMPPEGEKAIEHLMRKYGGTAEDVAAGTRSLRPGFAHREKTKPS